MLSKLLKPEVKERKSFDFRAKHAVTVECLYMNFLQVAIGFNIYIYIYMIIYVCVCVSVYAVVGD